MVRSEYIPRELEARCPLTPLSPRSDVTILFPPDYLNGIAFRPTLYFPEAITLRRLDVRRLAWIAAWNVRYFRVLVDLSERVCPLRRITFDEGSGREREEAELKYEWWNAITNGQCFALKITSCEARETKEFSSGAEINSSFFSHACTILKGSPN